MIHDEKDQSLSTASYDETAKSTERPYQCNICSRNYATRKGLRRHTSTKHTEGLPKDKNQKSNETKSEMYHRAKLLETWLEKERLAASGATRDAWSLGRADLDAMIIRHEETLRAAWIKELTGKDPAHLSQFSIEKLREVVLEARSEPSVARSPEQRQHFGTLSDSRTDSRLPHPDGLNLLDNEDQKRESAMPGVIQLDHKNDERTESIQLSYTIQERSYPCGIDRCSKSFPSRYNLRRHQRCTHVTTTVQCDIDKCSRTFAAREYLIEHQKRMHATEKPFRCDVGECSKTFASRQDLQTHQRLHAHPTKHQKSTSHSIEWSLQCGISECSKTFRRRCDLTRHQQRTHATEKPFTVL